MRRFSGPRLGLALLGLSGSALADFPSIDPNPTHPPTDPAGSLYLEPAATPGTAAFNAAAWFSYGYRPVVVRGGDGSALATLVHDQVVSYLVANVGVSPRAAVGLELPVLLYQHGTENEFTRAVTRRGAPPAQALGDTALVLKGNLIPEKPLGGFGLSALGRFTFPTGASGSYLGETAPVTELRLLGEYRLIAVALQATAGFTVRSGERDVLTRTYSDEVPWGIGLSVRPQAFGWDEGGKWTWVAEAHGAFLLPPSSEAQNRGQRTPLWPAVAGVSARYALGHDLSVLLGAELGLTRAFGDASVRGILSFGWAPRAHDSDGDGVPDDADQCPELAEDRDGFEDSDGCPDWDNDGDDVPDVDDACPNVPGVATADRATNGCPGPSRGTTSPDDRGGK